MGDEKSGMSGGSAMYRGANFQAEVAAFFAVVALSEDTTTLPEEVRTMQSPTRIGAEQNWPMDDTAVWFGDDARTFVQVKQSLSMSDAVKSLFGDVVEQMVKQWIHGRDRVTGTALRPADRLLLVVGAGGSGPIREELRLLLHRISFLAANEPLAAATHGETATTNALSHISGHVRRVLRDEGKPDDEATVRAVLRHVRVWPTTSDFLLQQSRVLLRTLVVADATAVDSALNALLRQFAVAAERRTAHDVDQLRQTLRNLGIVLKEPPSMAPDVAVLEDVTSRTLSGDTRVLRTHEGDIRIQRPIVDEVVQALRHSDLIVTGEGGAGKSDVLMEAAIALRAAGERVVFLDVAQQDMAVPRRALGLAHDLEVVLERSGDPNRVGYLFIDGFDSTRIGPALESLVKLLRRLRNGPRSWRVAVASRAHDLMHAGVVAELFPFDPTQPLAPERRDGARFTRHAHLVVPRLTGAELASAAVASPALAGIIAKANVDLLELLRNPFNLSVAASFTLGGGDVPDLSQVRSQIQLLDLWWMRRVVPGAHALAKERILRTAARAMVAARSLRVSPDLLPESPASNDLLSSTVLEIGGSRSRDLRFRHAIVFDYAVYRMLLVEDGSLARLLDEDRDAFLFVLPAIRMHFDELWSTDLPSFYREVATLFDQNRQRRTLLMIIARIPFEKFTTAADLLPLLNAEDLRSLAAMRYIVRTLIHERGRGEAVAGEDARPWAELGLEMARRLPRHEHDTLLLLGELHDVDAMTPGQRSQAAEAARLAVTCQLDRLEYQPRFMRMAIESFATWYDEDSGLARPLLDRIIEPARIARYGQYELEPLGSTSPRIHDAEALETMYAAVFSDATVDPGNIAIGEPSTLMGLVQSGTQSVEMARWNLAQRFPALVEQHPATAVHVLARVIDREADKWSVGNDDVTAIPIGSCVARIRRDGSSFLGGDVHEHDDWRTMANTFETTLRERLTVGDTHLFNTALRELSGDAHSAYLWQVLLRVAGTNAESSRILVPFLTDTESLASSGLGSSIATFLSMGFDRLEPGDQRAIADALLSLPDAAPHGNRHREHFVDLQLEYVRSIPLGSRDERLSALLDSELVRDEDHDGDSRRERRALLFDGFYVGGATSSEIALSLNAVEAGASPELAAAIEAMRPQIIINAAPADVSPYMEGLRNIDRLSCSEVNSVRQASLDVIAAGICKGLEYNAFTTNECAELLPLVVAAAHGEHPGYADPVKLAQAEAQFARNPSWGSPCARSDAVQCLWRMYRLDPRAYLLSEIERLVSDVDPGVRYLAIEGARATRTNAPEVGWRLAEAGLADSNKSIWAPALHVADALCESNAQRRDEMTLTVYDRLAAEPDRSDLRLDLLRWLLDRAIYESREDAVTRLRSLLDEPWRNNDLGVQLAFELGNRMNVNVTMDRRRIVASTIERLVFNLLERASQLTDAYGYTIEQYPEPQAAEMRTVLKLLTEIAQRIYFSSGVMQRTAPSGFFEDTGVINAEDFALLRPLLASIGTFRFSATSYYVVKTLVGAIDTAPRDVLLLATSTVMNGVRGGLLNETMAEDDVRNIVKRYVRSYRGLLETDRECLAAVMDVVDAYVDAGWPQWIEVVTELDSIYRSE